MRVKLVDLSHLMNVHTPGWVGYAGNKMYYAQNLQTKMIVAQRIDMALHVGTHIDGAMHGADGMGDILILHTGWHRYWEGKPQQDLVRYFCMHPGGKFELLEWMLSKRIKWFGIDCGSGDHAMNN